ncbi:MAG: alpha-amylase family glycosyl hydrolase, partial [Myxococcota bacterium]
MQTWPGAPYPLGATWDGCGVNFALFSEHAVGVELCLYHPGTREPFARVALCERTDLVWHVYLPDARPGLEYGYRVYGPWRPTEGLRFNAHKLLLDPYGKGIQGQLRFGQGIFGHALGAKRDADLHMDTTDSGPQMLRSVVVDGGFDWGDSVSPRTPWHETVIYELHVRGFTLRHPDIPPSLRGTYLGLASEPAIAHLKSLGVTAVELMPIHSFLHEPHLLERGHRNYWGYHTLGFFSPHLEYASSNHPEQALREVKTMVKALHHAGIEVILDVVYNHTAEGDQRGPTLCFRGIDNTNYYRLVEGNERY